MTKVKTVMVLILATLVAGGAFAQNTQAEELAANINKIKRGSAAVSGAAVTLAGEVDITKALVVPEGVTLDVTADKAVLRLGNKATLTVNGAMNVTGHGDRGKGWVNGSLQSNGTAVIAGTGTINLKGKGLLLNIGGGNAKVKLTLDGVTLVGVKDNIQSLVGIGKGGEFVLKSGAVTGNTRVSDEWASGGGVSAWRGTFTMEGGTISGNTANGKDGGGGGGVNIGDKSVFTMKGGEIRGNSANANGGGVAVERGAKFTMEGGTISGNSANANGKDGQGGGVYVSENSTFIMQGGTISANSLLSKTGNANGGGVGIQSKSVFTMTGGTITGNTAVGGRFANGGGVGLSGPVGAAFTMSGGTISGNTAGEGGGVCATGGTPSTFIMQGGVISGNTAANGEGGGVRITNGSVFIMEGGTIYGKAASLPAGTNPNLANKARNRIALAASGTAKWGTGGDYKGGASQTSGGDIGSTDDTLIATK